MATTPFINSNINDFGQFAKLRGAARNNDPQALKAAARQFEALFTQQLLKTVRQAKIGDDMMGGEQTEFYQGMFDQQMAQKLSEGRGLGIADLLVRQLQGAQATKAADAAEAAQKLKPLTLKPATELKPLDSAVRSIKTTGTPPSDATASLNFVSEMLPHAEAAARELGIPARVLVAQAALETGWGKHQIKNSDGTSSYNFFGIKADAGWNGSRVNKTTVEYENGSPQKQVAAFRSYASAEEAFKDYVDFLRTQPRYAVALDHGGDASRFAHGLQKAGYATDPAYAAKIGKIASGRLMTLALATASGSGPVSA